MTAEQLAGFAGLVLSLVLAYVPGLRERYDALTSTWKVTILGILLIVVAGGALALSCTGIVASVTCDKPGVLGLLEALIAALVTSQGTYVMLVRPFKQNGTGGVNPVERLAKLG